MADFFGSTKGTFPPPTSRRIKSIEDLKGKGDLFKGKIVGVEEGSGGTKMSRAALPLYDLPDKYKYVSSSAAMVAEAKAACLSQKPIVFMIWRPPPIFDKFCFNMREDPKNAFAFDKVKYAMNMDKFLVPRSDMEKMLDQNGRIFARSFILAIFLRVYKIFSMFFINPCF